MMHMRPYNFIFEVSVFVRGQCFDTTLVKYRRSNGIGIYIRIRINGDVYKSKMSDMNMTDIVVW